MAAPKEAALLLGITYAANFTILNPDRCCHHCQKLPLEALFNEKSNTRLFHHLGAFRYDICEAGQNDDACPFCSLVHSSMEKLELLYIKSPSNDHLYPFIDMYSLGGGSVELRIYDLGRKPWWISGIPDGWKNWDPSNAFIIQKVSDTIEMPSKSDDQVATNQVVDFNMITRWTQTCFAKHGGLCNESVWHIADQDSQPLRLIDAKYDCVIQTPPDASFIALSYVWGMEESLALKRTNLAQMSKKSGLQEFQSKIPKTISDAITLCKKCGQRYLWVDRLCILQDDETEKLDQINKMDRIFGSASFTIIAADGSDAGYGLPGVLPKSRHVRYDLRRSSHAFEEDISPTLKLVGPLRRSQRETCSSTSAASENNEDSNIGENQNLELATLQSFQEHPLELLARTTWSSRAWTFQEWVLSRRLLIFQSNQVFWSCRQATWCEGFNERKADPAGFCIDPSGQVVNKLQLHLGLSDRGAALGYQDGSIERERNGSVAIVRSDAYTMYCWAVRNYTQRQLRHENDMLYAFEGISKILAPSFASQILYGMPVSLLDCALLWSPAARLRRRKGDGFPSWSWSGWVGPVRYEEPYGLDNDDVRRNLFKEESGPERLRCAVRWALYASNGDGPVPLNEHGYGIAAASNVGGDLPRGWDTVQKASLKDCPPAPSRSSLVPQCLLVYTSYARLQISWNKLMPWSKDIVNFDILGDANRGVGSDVFDGDPSLTQKRYLTIVISQAQCFATEEQNKARKLYEAPTEYKLYNVLLVEEDTNEGVVRRLGLARVYQEDFDRVALGSRYFVLA